MKKKLVRESLIEGVGDKYLQRKYPQIPDEFDDFNKAFAMNQLEKNKKSGHNEIVFRKENYALIKNPTSIKDLESGVRGIITNNGDIYMGNIHKGIIHVDIINILKNLNILPANTKNVGWGKKLPQETGFLTVQRYKDTNYIAIGESNKAIYDEKDWKEKIHKYDEFLNKAKSKNPTLNLTNKLVGVKLFKRAGHDEPVDSHTLKESYDNQPNLMAFFIKNL